MKAGWQSKRLEETLLKTETVNPLLKPEVEFEYIDVSSVSNQTFQIEGTQQLKGKDAPSRARKLVKTNDILFATIRPTLQRIAIVPAELNNQVCSTGYFVLRPNQTIHFKYLYFYLFSDFFMGQMEVLQKGASYPAVTDNEVKSQNINFPSIQEQQRIVAILDEAFEHIAIARANTEKNLQNARALFESHLQSVFTQRGEGWVSKNLGDISRINYGYTESASFEKVGPNFLRITDVQDNGVDWQTVPYCKISGVDLPKYLLKTGDIVFARTGATTGKSFLVENPPVAVFASYLIRVQLQLNELLPNFLFLFFQTKNYWDEVNKGMSGSAQGGFNATKLAALSIPYPISIKEQQSVIHKLSALSNETKHLESLYQRKLSALDELKKSLLHKAFAGEL